GTEKPKDDLVQLALKLDYNPVKIFNWVYENIEFEDYELSRKGARSTYYTGRGNEWDQSSLLLTLLRISNVPARYARISGTNNVYVEAWLPLDNYRGQATGDAEDWVPLVAWDKEYRVSPGIDLFPDANPDDPNYEIPEALKFDTDAYLEDIKISKEYNQKTPLEFFEEQIQNYLSESTDKSLAKAVIKNIPYRETIIQRSLSILPTSLPKNFLPGKVISFSEIDNSDRAKIRLDIEHRDGHNLISELVYLPEIAGRRFYLHFIEDSETQSDEVKPVLTIAELDGSVIRESKGDPMKKDEEFRQIYQGGGFQTVIRPYKQAGTFMQMSFDALAASGKIIEKMKRELAEVPFDQIYSDDQVLKNFLSISGMILASSYQLDEYEGIKKTADLLHCKLNWMYSIQPTFFYTSIYNESSEIAWDEEAKFWFHPQWNIDAQTSTFDFYKAEDSPEQSFDNKHPFTNFTKVLYMYAGSYNEGRIFEKWMNTPGMSTIKGIMWAHANGVTVANLTADDFQQPDPDTNKPYIKTQTFDDEPIPVDLNTFGRVLNGDNKYDGFTWWPLYEIPFEGGYVLSNKDWRSVGADWSSKVEISRSIKWNFIGAELSGINANDSITVKGFRGGKEKYSKEIDLNSTPTFHTFDFNEIDKLTIKTTGSFYIDDFKYSRSNYLPALENVTVNPLPTAAIESVINELETPEGKEPSEWNANAVVPTQMIKDYEGLSGYVYIANTPTHNAYMFNMNHGGKSAKKVTPDNTVAQVSATNYTSEYRDGSRVQAQQFADVGKDSGTVNITNAGDQGVQNKAAALLYSAGDPVNMVNGEFYTEEYPDFLISSPGLDLSIVRNYRSKVIYNGPFGYGWTWNHGEQLLVKTNGDIVYYNNQVTPYYLTAQTDENGGTSYDYPPGTTFVLENNFPDAEQPNAVYVLTLKDNRRFFFDNHGRLIRKEDRFGNHLVFAYEDTTHPDFITKITDTLYRSLTLTPNAAGKVSQVADFTRPTARTCSYAYTGDDLTEFTDLEEKITRFEYLSDQANPLNNHNMSKYILPNDDYLEIGYYHNDQAAYHRNRKGQTFNFQYDRINRYGETWNEEGYYRKVFFDTNYNVIRVDNEDGTLELKEYDDNHNMTLHVDANGYQTKYTYDSDPKRNRNLLAKERLGNGNPAVSRKWTYQYASENNPH
ncbi:MAG: hypothetical protein D3922_01860, partial [Candidatus Electrothrix sp. AR1]|nr:hypothetical protein [Candidatus Electrothrix sp. AR1]